MFSPDRQLGYLEARRVLNPRRGSLSNDRDRIPQDVFVRRIWVGGRGGRATMAKNLIKFEANPPVKSRGSLQSATRTFLIGPGVFRLRPTNRGMPSETTAATAAISPFRSASSALSWE